MCVQERILLFCSEKTTSFPKDSLYNCMILSLSYFQQFFGLSCLIPGNASIFCYVEPLSLDPIVMTDHIAIPNSFLGISACAQEMYLAFLLYGRKLLVFLELSNYRLIDFSKSNDLFYFIFLFFSFF